LGCRNNPGAMMIKWAFIFLAIGLIAGALSFGSIAGMAFGIARFLFVLAIALFVLFLILGLVAAKKLG
jgi:uncharacterized membrane protein YtjA (UPF0391 family)